MAPETLVQGDLDGNLGQLSGRPGKPYSGRCLVRARLNRTAATSAASAASRVSATSARPASVRGLRPRWWIELLFVLGGYGIYHEAQIHAPSGAAIQHGWQILRAQQWLHLGLDGDFNRIMASSSWLAVPAEYYYATLHFAVTVGVLVWLWMRHPDRYRQARRVIVGGTLISLAVFWAYPAAPPRLLPHAGFIDTALRYRIPLDLEAGKASKAADLYATIPSLHFGWSLWAAWALSNVIRNPMARRLVWAYPVLTGLVVMGTANHFALDLAAGGIVMILGALVTVWLPRHLGRLGHVGHFGRSDRVGSQVRAGRDRRWLVPVAAVAGPVVLGALVIGQPHLLDGAVDAILRAHPVWLIAAVGAEIASMSAFSRLQRRTLGMTGYAVRRRTALAINYASNAISATVPLIGSAAGTTNTWRQYQKRGASPAAVTWALATAGVVSTLSFSLLMALVALTSDNPALAGAGAGATVVALGLAGGFVAMTRVPSLSDRIGRRLEALVAGLQSRVGRATSPSGTGYSARQFVERFMSYHPAPGSMLVAGGAGFINWALDVACLGLSIHAVGGHVSLTALVVVWAAGGAASSLSFTPSGLGIVEPILAAGLTAAGLPHTKALAATALYRLISFILVAAAGWIVQLSLTRRVPVAVGIPAAAARVVPEATAARATPAVPGVPVALGAPLLPAALPAPLLPAAVAAQVRRHRAGSAATRAERASPQATGQAA